MDKSKKKEKKGSVGLIWVLIVIILIIVVIVAVTRNKKSENVSSNNVVSSNTDNNNGYVQEIENGVKLNTSSKLNEAKSVGGFKFTNVQLTTKDGITTLLMDVTNISGTKTELKNVRVTLLDEKGNELTTVKGVITALDSNGSTQVNIATTSDYINAYDFSISLD